VKDQVDEASCLGQSERCTEEQARDEHAHDGVDQLCHRDPWAQLTRLLRGPESNGEHFRGGAEAFGEPCPDLLVFYRCADE
jgi:hypothetical protein